MTEPSLRDAWSSPSYWHHPVLDDVRNTGQVILLRKDLLPGADPALDPYGGLGEEGS